MQPKFIANENFPGPSIRRLRDLGFDITAVIERCPGTCDAEIMALARHERRWLLTYDRDYGELVFKRSIEPPPAILYFRQEPFPATRAADLVLSLLDQSAEIEGYLVVVGERNLRRHRLPL